MTNDEAVKTDKMEAFLAEWKAWWAVPTDWTPSKVKDGNSSMLQWAGLINATATSMDVILSILSEFHADRFGPRFGPFRRIYNTRTRVHQEHKLIPCQQCESTGLLIVPVKRVKGTIYLVTKPIPARNLSTTAVPCNCDRGRKVLPGYPWCSEDEQQWRRAIAARQTGPGFAALVAECRALAGVEKRDHRTPDDEGEWIAAVARLRGMGDDLPRHVAQLTADSEVRKDADDWWDDRDQEI